MGILSIRSDSTILIAGKRIARHSDFVWVVNIFILECWPQRIVLLILFVALDSLGGWPLLLSGAHAQDSSSLARIARTWRTSHRRKIVGVISRIGVAARVLGLVLISVLALVEHPLVLLVLVLSEGPALAALTHGSLVNKL